MTYIAHAYKTIKWRPIFNGRQMERAVYRFCVQFYSYEDDVVPWTFALENAVLSC